MVLATVFNTLGPLLVGAAVADTIGGIVAVDGRAAIEVIAAGLVAAVAWNLLTWRLGLPSSSGHALVGGLVGAALVEGGADAVNWGGLDGLRPVGVIGTALALAVAPVLGALAALVATRALRRALRRATRRWRAPIRAGEWAMSAGLAFSHGANDAQKAVGLLAALLVADGRLASPSARRGPSWHARRALTAGTAIGGWRIVKKVGTRHLPHPARGGARQPGGVGRRDLRRLARSGRPVSTTQVVASSVVGVGGGRRRWRHVRWAAVRRHGARVGADDPGDGRARRAHAADPRWHRMSRGRWFLPHDPDILGLLTRQLAVTTRGWRRSRAGRPATTTRRSPCATASTGQTWSGGSCTRRCATAFVTPVEPEDLYALSRGSDEVLNQAKDAVRESEVMACRPDDPFAEMAGYLAEATRRLADAVAHLERHARSRVQGRRRCGQVRPPPRARLPRGDGRAARDRRPARGDGAPRALPALLAHRRDRGGRRRAHPVRGRQGELTRSFTRR